MRRTLTKSEFNFPRVWEGVGSQKRGLARPRVLLDSHLAERGGWEEVEERPRMGGGAGGEVKGLSQGGLTGIRLQTHVIFPL